jgi:hypothetical protein
MEKVEIKESKVWRLITNLMLVIWFVYVIAQVGVDHLGFAVFFIILLAVIIASNLVYINATRLVIDNKGIALLDPQLAMKPTLFLWDEIEDVIPDSLLGKGVVLKMRNPGEFRKKFSMLVRFNLAVRKLIWNREYWIPLTALETPAGEAESIILRAFEQHRAQGACS